MNSKEKMLEVIKKKKVGGGKDIQNHTAKNDRKYMRKAPILFNK